MSGLVMHAIYMSPQYILCISACSNDLQFSVVHLLLCKDGESALIVAAKSGKKKLLELLVQRYNRSPRVTDKVCSG